MGFGIMHFNKAGLAIFLMIVNFKAISQSEISDSLLKAHVEVLAHDSMQGRFTGTEGAEKAAQYIASQMEQIGLQPMLDSVRSYFLPWKYSTKRMKLEGKNVSGVILGTCYPDSLIIFSAHYDHIGVLSSQKALPFRSGFKRVKGDSIFNGANDNATGVAALLELARVYANTKPLYTIVFIAFSGEEWGLLGSDAFVKNLDPEKVKLNINLEMLGRPGKIRPYLTLPDWEVPFLEMLNRNLMMADATFGPDYFEADSYSEENFFERSDNVSFHKKGIPAYSIMGTPSRDEYYHSAADHAGTIQFREMTRIVQGIALGMLPILVNKTVIPYKY